MICHKESVLVCAFQSLRCAVAITPVSCVCGYSWRHTFRRMPPLMLVKSMASRNSHPHSQLPHRETGYLPDSLSWSWQYAQSVSVWHECILKKSSFLKEIKRIQILSLSAIYTEMCRETEVKWGEQFFILCLDQIKSHISPLSARVVYGFVSH